MLNSKEGNSIYVKSKRYSKNNSNGPLFNIQYDQETPAYILLISRIINSNIYKIILFIFTVLFNIIFKIYTLFGEDIRIWLFPKSLDTMFFALTLVFIIYLDFIYFILS